MRRLRLVGATALLLGVASAGPAFVLDAHTGPAGEAPGVSALAAPGPSALARLHDDSARVAPLVFVRREARDGEVAPRRRVGAPDQRDTASPRAPGLARWMRLHATTSSLP